MKLCSFESPYGARLGVVLADQVLDLNGSYVRLLREDGIDLPEAVEQAGLSMPPSMRKYIGLGETAQNLATSVIERARATNVAVTWPLAQLQLLPPVTDPGKIMGLKGNYRRPGPSQPTWFLKPRTALIGSGRSICYPPFSRLVQHECELAIVVGRRARNVKAEDAHRYVAGYTLMNDVTASDLAVLDDKWYDRSKGLDTFGPCGPWMVTADELREPHALTLICRVNGEPRQEIHTADMIYHTPAIIAQLSLGITLEPGDIITTGTTNIGAIQPGDMVEIECEGIGTLRSPVIAG